MKEREKARERVEGINMEGKNRQAALIDTKIPTGGSTEEFCV